MLRRHRHRFVAVAGAMAMMAMAGTAPAQPEARGEPLEDRRAVAQPVANHQPRAVVVDRAVAKGLRFLADQQDADGGFVCDVGYKLNQTYRVTAPNTAHVGVTAVAGLAFLAAGHSPIHGEYAPTVRRAMEFLLRHADGRDGVQGFIHHHGTRMRSHAFAMLFFAELLAANELAPADAERVRHTLRMATRMLGQTQSRLGGWRYTPYDSDDDLPCTVTVLQALYAAQAAGIDGLGPSIESAENYVRRCWSGRAPVGFMYQIFDNAMPNLNTRTSSTLTSAGLYVLSRMAPERWPMPPTAIDPLARLTFNDFRRDARAPVSPFSLLYGWYYFAQAMRQWHPTPDGAADGAGATSPVTLESWPTWQNEFIAGIIDKQKSDGFWEDQVGRNYGTAMTCLILQLLQPAPPSAQADSAVPPIALIPGEWTMTAERGAQALTVFAAVPVRQIEFDAHILASDGRIYGLRAHRMGGDLGLTLRLGPTVGPIDVPFPPDGTAGLLVHPTRVIASTGIEWTPPITAPAPAPAPAPALRLVADARLVRESAADNGDGDDGRVVVAAVRVANLGAGPCTIKTVTIAGFSATGDRLLPVITLLAPTGDERPAAVDPARWVAWRVSLADADVPAGAVHFAAIAVSADAE